MARQQPSRAPACSHVHVTLASVWQLGSAWLNYLRHGQFLCRRDLHLATRACNCRIATPPVVSAGARDTVPLCVLPGWSRVGGGALLNAWGNGRQGLGRQGAGICARPPLRERMRARAPNSYGLASGCLPSSTARAFSSRRLAPIGTRLSRSLCVALCTSPTSLCGCLT